MRLVIQADTKEVGSWTARYVKRRILDFAPNKDRYFVLGLPTGAFCEARINTFLPLALESHPYLALDFKAAHRWPPTSS